MMDISKESRDVYAIDVDGTRLEFATEADALAYIRRDRGRRFAAYHHGEDAPGRTRTRTATIAAAYDDWVALGEPDGESPPT
jgi:hypothetical protein